MPENVEKERIYNGLYRHSADSKRRVPIPFRWRPEKSDESFEFTLIIWPKHQAGTCLRVLPPDQMAKLLGGIDALADSDPNKGVLKRWIGTDSVQAKLDSVGRVTVPEDMAAAADIKDEVVLAGMLNRFEMWNPKRYEQVQSSDKAILSQAIQFLE